MTIAAIVLVLVAGVAYWLYAENDKQALAQQQSEERQRAKAEQLKQERASREREERERMVAKMDAKQRDVAQALEESAKKVREQQAKDRAKAVEDRTTQLKQRTEDANRAVASLKLVNDAVQTIRPFAFVGTRPQENARQIAEFVLNACNKIQTAQSAPCIDALKSTAGYYCQAVMQVSQQSILNPEFFFNEAGRLRLHNWMRDNGYQYDAAFNNCQAALEKERASVKQESDELNKLRNVGR